MEPNAQQADHSQHYRAQLRAALEASRTLGFQRAALIEADSVVSDQLLAWSQEFVNGLSSLFNLMLPSYWGNACQTLSSHLFAHLNAQGVPAEIVLGNVMIQGEDAFGTTLDALRAEYCSTVPLIGSQQVHAWVSLGGDTIIDAALPPRLAQRYGAPERFNDTIFIARAGQLASRLEIVYQPMLVGSEFFAKTNPPDPMNMLNELRARR